MRGRHKSSETDGKRGDKKDRIRERLGKIESKREVRMIECEREE